MADLGDLRRLHEKWRKFAVDGPVLAITPTRADGKVTLYAIDPGVTIDIWKDPLPDGHRVLASWDVVDGENDWRPSLVFEALSDFGPLIAALPALLDVAEVMPDLIVAADKRRNDEIAYDEWKLTVDEACAALARLEGGDA